jgi:hypothetical protein
LSNPFFIFAYMNYKLLLFVATSLAACTASNTTPEEDAIQELTVDAMLKRDSIRADSMLKSLMTQQVDTLSVN